MRYKNNSLVVAFCVLASLSTSAVTQPVTQKPRQSSVADLAPTVEELLALDSKMAIAAAKLQSPPPSQAALPSATGVSKSKKVVEPADQVSVEYIRGQGNEVTAGITLNGVYADVKQGSALGKYTIKEIRNRCVFAHRVVPTQEGVSPKKGASTSKKIPEAKPHITNPIWCFVDVPASALASAQSQVTTNVQGVQQPMPVGTPLPPGGIVQGALIPGR